MARLLRRDTIDPETAAAHVERARYMLRLAFALHVSDVGEHRMTVARIESLDAAGLQTLATRHRKHPAAQHALGWLARARGEAYDRST
jgi:hypothetical protein